MKIRDLLKAAIFILAVAALAIWLDEESWQPLGSGVRVVDGDSLAIGGQRLRLQGIDAPELEQTCLRAGKAVPCGLLARDHLAQLIRNAALACSERGLDKHGRTLAVCRWQSAEGPGDGALVSAGTQATINAQMVHDGWAVAYGDYKALEVLAALAGRGLWELEFDAPQDWRRENGIGQ